MSPTENKVIIIIIIIIIFKARISIAFNVQISYWNLEQMQNNP